ncbi:MAG: hypothetical protein ACREQQ_05610, partial [Candidatus Binatia bacterium]
LMRVAGSLPGAVRYGADPFVRQALLGTLVLALIALFVRLIVREARLGRLVAVSDAREVTPAWLEEHVFAYLPEVVGAEWDSVTSAPEVAASRTSTPSGPWPTSTAATASPPRLLTKTSLLRLPGRSGSDGAAGGKSSGQPVALAQPRVRDGPVITSTSGPAGMNGLGGAARSNEFGFGGSCGAVPTPVSLPGITVVPPSETLAPKARP